MPKDEVEGRSEKWELRARSLQQWDETLGRDVVVAFCQCFVHVDRLCSSSSCIQASKKCYGEESVSFKRDLNALMWFSVGCLNEMVTAIRRLRSALAKRKLLEPDSKEWVTLRELENRWTEKNNLFREARNTVSFHVDEVLVYHGLDSLRKERNVVFCEADGAKNVDSRLSLGDQALLRGWEVLYGLDRAKIRDFLILLRNDQMQAGDAIKRVFVRVAKKSGAALDRNVGGPTA